MVEGLRGRPVRRLHLIMRVEEVWARGQAVRPLGQAGAICHVLKRYERRKRAYEVKILTVLLGHHRVDHWSRNTDIVDVEFSNLDLQSKGLDLFEKGRHAGLVDGRVPAKMALDTDRVEWHSCSFQTPR